MSHTNTIAQIEVSWHLWQENIHPNIIAKRTGKHKATIYRWIRKFKRIGHVKTRQWYVNCKKGRRRKRISVELKLAIVATRNRYHQCCGEKIRYFLNKNYGYHVSVATIYRVLGEKSRISSKYKPRKYGEAPKGQYARDVIQADTVDFGEVNAYTYIDTFTREAHVDLELGLESEDGYASMQAAKKVFNGVRLLQNDGGPEFKGRFIENIGEIAQEHRVSRPYKKNEQSFIESFNRTLRKECLGWRKYSRKELPKMMEQVHNFLVYYHNERPHLGLGMLTPNEKAASCRI